MTRRLAILLTLLAPLAWAGDEFLTPTIRSGSGFESSDPKYRVVGFEDRGDAHSLFVVANPAAVLTQKGVNRIISDLQHRNLGFTDIWFYTSVRDKPRFPAFAIYEHLAVYSPKDNKIYYSVAAKKLYGGWAYGPQK
jgi:hypothetical protein